MAEDLYVRPESGKRLAATLRRGVVSGKYKSISDPQIFARILGEDMRSAVPDKHLQVRARIIEVNSAVAGTSADTPEAAMDRERRFERRAAYDGYGIGDVRVIAGNIGYLKLGEFWAPWVSGQSLTAAMDVLRDTDAFIVDLRESYGGHEDVVLLLMGYFLDTPQLIFTSVDRSAGTIDQRWSAPYVPGQPGGGIPTSASVYVLTSERTTFSAAEALALALKRKRNAVIVGERTRGGANGGEFRPLSCRFDAFMPYFGNSIDGENWDGVGITPDVAVPEAQALGAATRLALEKLVAAAPSEADSLSAEIVERRKKLLQSLGHSGT